MEGEDNKTDCWLDGQWVWQGDECRKLVLEGPGGEADGDVVDIVKGVKGDDIIRSTSGTAMGAAVGLQGSDVVGGTSDVTGGCWEGSCLGGRL